MNKDKITIVFIVVPVLITLFLFLSVPSPKSVNLGNSYNNSYNDNKLHTEYLRISNVSLENNSSYSVCTGTLSVASYSPYKFHFIELKAAFVNRYGSTVDTDWTYGIGSEWLEPGESTKFRMSVDKDYNITDCKVTIMED